MAYVKNNWTEGDVITAEKLNNLEEGVSEVGGVYELTVTEEEWREIMSSTYEEPWSKSITEEDFLKIKNSNILDLIINSPDNLSHIYLWKEQLYMDMNVAYFNQVIFRNYPKLDGIIATAASPDEETKVLAIVQLSYEFS